MFIKYKKFLIDIKGAAITMGQESLLIETPTGSYTLVLADALETKKAFEVIAYAIYNERHFLHLEDALAAKSDR